MKLKNSVDLVFKLQMCRFIHNILMKLLIIFVISLFGCGLSLPTVVWRNHLPAINVAVNDAFYALISEDRHELIQTQDQIQSWIRAVDTNGDMVAGVNFTELPTVLQRTESLIYTKCNRSLLGFWNECRQEYHGICLAEAEQQCPSLKLTEVIQELDERFGGTQVPTFFHAISIPLGKEVIRQSLLGDDSTNVFKIFKHKFMKRFLRHLHIINGEISLISSKLTAMQQAESQPVVVNNSYLAEMFSLGAVRPRTKRSFKDDVVTKMELNESTSSDKKSVSNSTPTTRISSPSTTSRPPTLATKNPKIPDSARRYMNQQRLYVTMRKNRLENSWMKLKERASQFLVKLQQGIRRKMRERKERGQHQETRKSPYRFQSYLKSPSRRTFAKSFKRFGNWWKDFDMKAKVRNARSVYNTKSGFNTKITIQTWNDTVSNGINNETISRFSATVTNENGTKVFTSQSSWLGSEERLKYKEILPEADRIMGSVPHVTFPEPLPVVKVATEEPRNPFVQPTWNWIPSSSVSNSQPYPISSANAPQQFQGSVTDESGTHHFTNEASYHDYIRNTRRLKHLKSINERLKDLRRQVKHWEDLKAKVESENYQGENLPFHSSSFGFPAFPLFPMQTQTTSRRYHHHMPAIQWQSGPTFYSESNSYPGPFGNFNPVQQGYSQTSRSYGPQSTYTSRHSSAYQPSYGSVPLHRAFPSLFPQTQNRQGTSHRREKRHSRECNFVRVLEKCAHLVELRGFCRMAKESVCPRLASENQRIQQLLRILQAVVKKTLEPLQANLRKYAWVKSVRLSPVPIQVISFQKDSSQMGGNAARFSARVRMFGSHPTTIRINGLQHAAQDIATRMFRIYKDMILA